MKRRFVTEHLIDRLRERKAVALALFFLSLALISVLDLLIPFDFSFSLFYLIPVFFAVIGYGTKGGIVASLLTVVLGMGAQIISGPKFPSPYVPVWNGVTRLVYYILISTLISRVLGSMKRLEESSLKDPLTEASNRRHLDQYMQMVMDRARREDLPLTVAFLDIDDFKDLNDFHGHEQGDNALRSVATAIKGQIRPDDLLVRLGGDEFLLVMVNVHHGLAETIGHRILAEIRRVFSQMGVELTLSVGMVSYAKVPFAIDEILKHADSAMYQAKGKGKNGIVHVMAE